MPPSNNDAKKADKSRIPFPHDTFFKESLRQLPIAHDFFQHNLPAKVLKEVDLSTLSLHPSSFTNEKGKSSFKDIVYQVNIKDKPGRLFLLWEHQSCDEPWMALRIQEYLMNFFRHCVKQELKQLPRVICCMFYHGQRSPYPYTTDFLTYLKTQTGRETIFFSRFIWWI